VHVIVSVGMSAGEPTRRAMAAGDEHARGEGRSAEKKEAPKKKGAVRGWW